MSGLFHDPLELFPHPRWSRYEHLPFWVVRLGPGTMWQQGLNFPCLAGCLFPEGAHKKAQDTGPPLVCLGVPWGDSVQGGPIWAFTPKAQVQETQDEPGYARERVDLVVF